MGPDHPFSWRKAYDGGRSWYTNGGANSADYDNGSSWSTSSAASAGPGGSEPGSGHGRPLDEGSCRGADMPTVEV